MFFDCLCEIENLTTVEAWLDYAFIEEGDTLNIGLLYLLVEADFNASIIRNTEQFKIWWDANRDTMTQKRDANIANIRATTPP